MPRIQNLREVLNTSMGSATSLSPAIDLYGYRVAAFDFSSGWDAANRMTFQGSYDFGTATTPTWRNLYDEVGTEYQIASGNAGSATGWSAALSPDMSLALSAHRYLRLRAGPATNATNPSTGVAISVIVTPM